MSTPDTSTNRDSKIPLLIAGVAGVVTLIVISAAVIGALPHQTTRTVYRTPVACTRAANEAATVIAHHRAYQPLIDVLTGKPQKHYTTRHPFQIPDWLPAYDGRVPDLGTCG